MTRFRPELVFRQSRNAPYNSCMHTFSHSSFSGSCTVTSLRAIPDFWSTRKQIKFMEEEDLQMYREKGQSAVH